MVKLTKRQSSILTFIRENKGVGTQEIKAYIEKKNDEELSRITIIRELDILFANKLIKREGAGRSVQYFESVKNKLFSYFNAEEYFKKSPDERKVAYSRFNFKVFDDLPMLFSKDELSSLQKINSSYQKRLKAMSKTIYKKELERLTVELSWKSSQIEGNTYSLIDTEILIKENKEASGHKKEEAIMILNHKKALDHIISRKEQFKKITLRNIENLHKLLIDGLGITTGLRSRLVGITGTTYKPLDNMHQIREALEKTIKLIEKLKNPLEKALVIILLISYIQPFEDGNKRTARILANAVLLAYDYCPLSYRSISESDYKKAVLLFYEQNSALFFKKLFIEQFEFSINNYFSA